MQQALAWAARSPPASAAAIPQAWRVEASLWQRQVLPEFDSRLRRSNMPVSLCHGQVGLRADHVAI